MATRLVEGKKQYTGGKAIEITKDKVINLKLRDENNLIIYDDGDNEIYVDLQLPNEVEPTDAFPVGVNVGRVIVDNGWDKTGTLISAKTTSGDNIKLLYADDGTLWIDNGTGTFKQILFKGDIDDIVATLTEYIDSHDTVVSDTAPEDPYEGQLWYDTVNDTLKVYDGSTWVSTGSGGGGDVQVSTQANNIFTPGMKIWGGTQSDYQSLTPDSNTAYLLLADQPTPPSPGRQPGVNTKVYYKINDNDTNSTIYDLSGNGVDQTWYGTPGYTTDATYGRVATFDGSNYTQAVSRPSFGSNVTIIALFKTNSTSRQAVYSQGRGSGLRPAGISINAWGSGKYEGIFYDGDETQSATSATANTWIMLAITCDGNGNRKIYVNGQLDGSRTAAVTPHSTGAGPTLGQWGDNSGYLNGQIKLIIGEDRTRTDQEIADLASEYGF